jgi:hypothetical protein
MSRHYRQDRDALPEGKAAGVRGIAISPQAAPLAGVAMGIW